MTSHRTRIVCKTSATIGGMLLLHLRRSDEFTRHMILRLKQLLQKLQPAKMRRGELQFGIPERRSKCCERGGGGQSHRTHLLVHMQFLADAQQEKHESPCARVSTTEFVCCKKGRSHDL